MDSADAGSRHRNSLPSIVNLDLDRVKVESADYQRPSISSQRPSEMSLTNSSSVHSGPPPPYSYPSSTASSAPGITGYISPPDSRRTYEDDKESKAQRQSLPSIHEALGADKSLTYTSSVPKPQQQPPHPAHPQPGTQVTQRPHQDGAPPGPPNPFSQAAGPPYLRENPYAQPRSQPETSRPNPSLLHQENPAPSFMPVNGPRSPPPPPRSSVQPYPPGNYPATYDYQSKPGPAVASSPRTYNHPPQEHYVYSSQPQPGAPVYAPAQYEHRSYPSSWKSATEHQYDKYAVPRGAGPMPPHNESIKRQLDVFDIETSLNEVAEGCERVLEFSRIYGARGHQTDRTGPVPGSTPSIPELDEMLRMNARVADTLARLRSMAINQQHMAEQRVMNQSFEGAYDEDGNPYNDDYKGGNSFAGGDAKKRRGKAAPPGRCHSCNRAETPEWRRGPDGARTLCNACGLHYAKLTRKMGAKGASIAGSNLRPKNMES